jgi:hypothetical protein
MKSILFGAAAFLLISSPAWAEKVTPADAVKVISQITADKEKTKTYCEAQSFYNQAADSDVAAEAESKKDAKKAEELGKKAEELGKQGDALIGKLGDDYKKLDEALKEIKPEEAESADVKAIIAEFGKLDELCSKK